MVKKDIEILAEHQNELAGPDQSKWENGGYYGENPQRMSREEWENFKKQKAKPTSIRLPSDLEEALKQYAVEHGLTYHSAIRSILTERLLISKSKI